MGPSSRSGRLIYKVRPDPVKAAFGSIRERVMADSGFRRLSRETAVDSCQRAAHRVTSSLRILEEITMKILLMTGDAGEAQEIYYAKYRLEEEGWTVHIATLARRVFMSVVHDFDPDFDTYTEKPGYRVESDLGFDDVQASEYDGLVLPGGRAPEYLRNRPKAVAIVRHFVEAKKPIAANCHGPLLVIAAGGMSGRRTTCYPELEPDVRAAGGEFVNRDVVVDGNLISVRGWPDNGPWMREFVKLLKTRKGVG